MKTLPARAPKFENEALATCDSVQNPTISFSQPVMAFKM
jgi:hypothetical protein